MNHKQIPVNSSGGFVRLVDHMGDDSSPAQAARVSYGAGTKTITEDKDLTRFLMRHEHFSPFAMAQVKLHMRFPIFIHNQMVRHDRFHWNLMSGRYSVMPDEKWIPEEEEIRAQGTGNKQVGNAMMLDYQAERAHTILSYANNEAQDSYDLLLGLGVCREQARTVLPMGQYSEGYATANLGDWLLFLKQRLAPGAQKEIQEYATAIRDILRELFPTVMQACEDYQLNAVTFSAQEMIWIREALASNVKLLDANPDTRKQSIRSVGITNTREAQEFWKKLK